MYDDNTEVALTKLLGEIILKKREVVGAAKEFGVSTGEVSIEGVLAIVSFKPTSLLLDLDVLIVLQIESVSQLEIKNGRDRH